MTYFHRFSRTIDGVLTRTHSFFLSKTVSPVQNYRMLFYLLCTSLSSTTWSLSFFPNKCRPWLWSFLFSESNNEFSISLALHLTIDLEPQFLPNQVPSLPTPAGLWLERVCREHLVRWHIFRKLWNRRSTSWERRRQTESYLKIYVSLTDMESTRWA